MTSWLDTPLAGRELIEYAVARLPVDWEVRGSRMTLVGHAQGAGERPLAKRERQRRNRRR